MPYLPMVKAIAPKAPIGATFMTMLTTPKTACEISSISLVTGLPRSPSSDSEKPNRMAISSTCRMSPLVKASPMVLGMMFIRKLTTDWFLALAVNSAMDLVSSVAALAWKPSPGRMMLATNRPITSAKVEITEVEQRLAADAADLLDVLHAGDPGDDGAENHRRDNHLDQLDEAIAQRFHGDRVVGHELAQQHAAGNRKQHLHV